VRLFEYIFSGKDVSVAYIKPIAVEALWPQFAPDKRYFEVNTLKKKKCEIFSNWFNFVENVLPPQKLLKKSHNLKTILLEILVLIQSLIIKSSMKFYAEQNAS
jgi:hypothetical protein